MEAGVVKPQEHVRPGQVCSFVAVELQTLPHPDIYKDHTVYL